MKIDELLKENLSDDDNEFQAKADQNVQVLKLVNNVLKEISKKYGVHLASKIRDRVKKKSGNKLIALNLEIEKHGLEIDGNLSESISRHL